uniref:Protein kinase domain-containing protein n=1 Tax=viral metagenome TaxID=1070528 RepID=A0A6C0JJX1_9ZZZZ
MQNRVSEIFGEGTYGCVHKPSLKCKDSPEINYENKVSKILKASDAKTELKEYKNMKKADKNNEFYLGEPEECAVDNKNIFNLKSIQKCKIGSDVLKKLNNESYKLLIMENGGLNIEKYTEFVRTWPVSDESREKCERFLLESLRLFKGIKIFLKHGLIHHDLKPQNIVFDEVKNRLNYIDFGLMASKKKIIKQANASRYEFAIFHWSYPWELDLYDKDTFNSLVKSTLKQNETMSDINKEIAEKKNDYYYSHIETFFYYIFDKKEDLTLYQQECANYISGYERTLKQDMAEMGYDQFLSHSIDTIDIFGLGISMLYWLNNSKRFLTKELADDLEILFKSMVQSELRLRPNIDMLIQDMELLFEKHGLLQKHNKKIRDHLVVDSNTVSPIITKPSNKIFTKSIKLNRFLVETSPGSCPEGYVKNDLGKCIKIKLSRKLLEPCPEGKERNPITGRCVNIKVPKEMVQKVCPEGKEMNPKTRRCVIVCSQGYIRDENFKCKKNKTMKIRL